MKKFFSIAAAAALVLCMSFGVFAQGSVTTPVNSAVDAKGNAYVVSYPSTLPATQTIEKDVQAKVAISNVQSVTVLASFDLTAPAGTTVDPAGTVIRFDLGTVAVDANTRVMQQKTDGTWEDVTYQYGTANGSNWIEGKFTSFSPVAIVEAKANTTAASTASGTSASTSSAAAATSPKTGESNAAAIAVCAAAVAGAGALALAKKHA